MDKGLLKKLILGLALAATLAAAGCMSCIPQYTAPPDGPASACSPTGHDPYIPMEHNPGMLNLWDLARSAAAPFAYGPPR